VTCVLGLVSVAAGCRYLQVVYLRRCVNVGDEGIIALAHNCPHLKDLHIGGCILVTDASLQALSEHNCHLTSINFSRTNVCMHYCLYIDYLYITAVDCDCLSLH